MSERPDGFWPWDWASYSHPAKSFKEKSDEWERRRLECEPAGLTWLFIGMGIGLLLVIAQAC